MKTVSGWAYPDADDFMWREMTPEGNYQRGHLDAAMHYVTDFTCAVDGGAHVGTWSRILSGLFARVVAVEPAADTFEALVANMDAFKCPNVERIHAALGKAHGRVDIAPLDERQAALQNTGGRFVEPGSTIPLVPIDSWELPTLGFLKLDVEGSEVDALFGARETLARCRPIVLYENKGFCRRFGYEPDTPAKILGGLGYRHVCKAGKDDIWGPT